MMRVLLRSILLTGLIASSPAAAVGETPVVTLQGEAAWNGRYGLMGVETAIFPAPRLDVHFGAGLGASTMLGAGLRLHTTPDECFLFKYCSQRYSFAVTGSVSRKGRVTLKKDGEESIFAMPEVPFVSAAAGVSDLYFKHILTTLQLGYRRALREAKPELESGAENAEMTRELEAHMASGFLISLGLGLAF